MKSHVIVAKEFMTEYKVDFLIYFVTFLGLCFLVGVFLASGVLYHEKGLFLLPKPYLKEVFLNI